jgi:glycosyltransferase involved in cell wall biosynthesis
MLVLTDAVAGAPDREVVDGAEVVRLWAYLRAIAAPDLIRWEQMQFALVGEAAAAIGQGAVDVVHANSQECAVTGSMLALEFGVPLVCTFHEQAPEQAPLGAGRMALVHRYLPIDRVLAGSEFYRAKALAGGIEPTRVSLVYHGVDGQRFSPGPADPAFRGAGGEETILVVCAARISLRKGLDTLIRAVAVASQRAPGIRLVIAGRATSGSEALRAELLRLRADLGLDGRVDFDESLTLADMPALYRSADIVVQPSTAEGLGLALIEAMACERAVIGSDIPGIVEVIEDGIDGVLVEPSSVEALAKALVALAADPVRRAELGRNARTTFTRRFDLERAIDETERIYRALREDRGTAT